MIFRKALQNDFGAIWKIIQYAKEVRKQEGSSQWQDGYPNEQTIRSDIDKGNGYVMTINEKVVAYIAIIFEIEPAYEVIEGQWLSTQPMSPGNRLKERYLQRPKFEHLSWRQIRQGHGHIVLRVNSDILLHGFLL